MPAKAEPAKAEPSFVTEPSVGVAGQVVEARAVGERGGVWEVRDRERQRVEVEVDRGGVLRFVPPDPGVYEILFEGADVRERRVLEVVGASSRWLYAAGCVPLGVALLVVLRRRGVR